MRTSIVFVLAIAACRGEPPSSPPPPKLAPASSPDPALAQVPHGPPGIPGQPLVPRPTVESALPPSDPAIALVAADSVTCAMRASGAVSCWGGSYGTPHRIAGWTDITHVAFTGSLLCGLHRDGHVDCGPPSPTEVTGDTARVDLKTLGGVKHAVALAATADAVCILERSGEIGCWVDGDPRRVTRAHIDNASALVMGGLVNAEWQFPNVSYTCALTGGKLACFDVYRQATPEAPDSRSRGDTYVAAVGKAPRVHVGEPHVMTGVTGLTELLEPTEQAQICTRAGTTWPRCFSLTPVAEPRPAERPYVPPCGQHDAEITCSFMFRPAPVTVTLDHVKQLVTAWRHACAIIDGGNVACWGNNEDGQLGHGSPQAASTPVPGLHDAIDIVEWTHGAVALRANGQLAYWGRGNSGDPAPTDLPITFSTITDAVRLVAGHFHACVLRRVGTVACWGDHAVDAIEHRVPTEIAGLHDVRQLQATDFGFVARIANGTWLHLGDPQLGWSAAETPRPIAGAQQAERVVIAGHWICVLDRSPGKVRCWAEAKHWSTPMIELAEPNIVEIAGTGPELFESVPDALTAKGAPDRAYPRSQLVVRLADGRALAIDLHIDRAKPVATPSPLATDVRSLFTSDYITCARSASAVTCTSGDVVPSEYLDATSLIFNAPACALRPDHQVVCFTGDAFMTGTGLGPSDTPVPVPL